MQIGIYDNFDLFLTNVKKSELYYYISSTYGTTDKTFVKYTEVDSSTRFIGTQRCIESTVVDAYRENKQYQTRTVEVLEFKDEFYLMDGHHTYTAWILDGCPCKLKIALYKSKEELL